MEVISASDILAGLSSLREENTLCDITLKVEGKAIVAHRALLASVSPFFKALFTREFKEVNQDVIEIKEVSFRGMKLVIDCCYTSRLQLDPENLYDVLSAANHVQITKIVDSCKKFMTDNLNEGTCISFLGMAEIFSFEDVQREANEYILENFTAVRKTEEFKKLPKEKLIQYLSHDHLNVKGNECEAFYAARDWLECDEDRMQFAEEVISNIRFHLINDIDELSEIAATNLIDDRKECRALIREALVYQSKEFEKPLNNDVRTRPRGREGVLLTANQIKNQPAPEQGWKSNADFHIAVFSLHPKINSTFKSAAVGRFVRGGLNLVLVNNFLFLFATDNESFRPVTMRYDTTTDHWLTLTPCPSQHSVALVGSSTAMLGGYIYLISGMLVEEDDECELEGMDYSVKVLRYQIVKDRWEELAEIPHGSYKSTAAACSLNQCIYVCGGYGPYAENDITKCTKAFAFDTSSNLWLTKPAMQYGRYGHCMGLVQDKIFVFGGHDIEGKVEMFNISEDQWTTIESVSVDAVGSCAVVRDKDIFIFAAHLPESSPERVGVIIFNTTQHTVTVAEKNLPETIGCPAGGLVIHPGLL